MPVIRDILYVVAFLLGGWVIPLRWRLRRRRKLEDWQERCGRVTPREGDRPCLWVHGVSVGEVNSARLLVEQFVAKHSDWDVVFSTVTDTGVAAARRMFPDRRVFRFPIDFSRFVRRGLDRIRPTLIVLMEGDVWPNFVGVATSRGIPVVIAGGRVGDNSFPCRCVKRFFLGGTFARFARIGAQTDAYAERFKALGARKDRVVVTGSLKWDAVPREASDAAPLRRALGIADDEIVLLAGSTAPGEDKIFLDVFAALRRRFPKLRLVIVPRHPERFDPVAELVLSRGFACVRRSEKMGTVPSTTNGGQSPFSPTDAVILGDSMGEMMTYYALSDVAFVGKSLIAPGGGQNMIEPASLGKPVIFGPYTGSFPMVRDALLAKGAAMEVKDAAGLQAGLSQLFADAGLRATLGANARAVVDAHRGAAARTLDILEDVLAKAGKSR